jgi:hypothetical protein
MMIHTTTYDMCQEFMAQKFRHVVRIMNDWTIEQERVAKLREQTSPPEAAPETYVNQF